MERRTFLAAAGAAALAGCSSLPGMGPADADGDGVPDDEDYAPNDPSVQEKADIETPTASPTPPPTPTESPTPVPTPTPFPFQQVNPWFEPSSNQFAADYASSGGGRLGPGEFGALSWASEESFNISYAFAVRNGGPIDVLLLTQRGWDSFRQTQSAGIIADGSVLGQANGQAQIDLSAGTYFLVFDNSFAAAARPEGEVEFVYGVQTE